MPSGYYSALGAEKTAYEDVLHAIENRASYVDVPFSVEPVRLYFWVVDDYPWLFYAPLRIEVQKRMTCNRIVLRYVYTRGEIESIDSYLRNKIRYILAGHITPEQSEYEKVKCLYDYLMQTVQFNDELPAYDNPVTMEQLENHTIVGALRNKSCVCEGIAKAFALLCNAAGVECLLVTGKARRRDRMELHAWNMVRIDGCYQHVDVTWDINFSAGGTAPNYCYFNLTDREMALDHSWDRGKYPVCLHAPHNYYRLNHAVVADVLSFQRMVRDCVLKGQYTIPFCAEEGSPFASRLKENIIRGIESAFLTISDKVSLRYELFQVEGRQACCLCFRDADQAEPAAGAAGAVGTAGGESVVSYATASRPAGAGAPGFGPGQGGVPLSAPGRATAAIPGQAGSRQSDLWCSRASKACKISLKGIGSRIWHSIFRSAGTP